MQGEKSRRGVKRSHWEIKKRWYEKRGERRVKKGEERRVKKGEERTAKRGKANREVMQKKGGAGGRRLKKGGESRE